MKKIKVRQLGIAAILLLCAVFCQGQRQQDTVKVAMLVCDTSRQYFVNTYMTFDTVINGMGRGKIINDTSWRSPNGIVYWVFGYSVRELHNTSEGVMDAGGQICVENGVIVSCWHDYWKHLYYLDDKKQPIKTTLIIWQSVSAK